MGIVRDMTYGSASPLAQQQRSQGRLGQSLTGGLGELVVAQDQLLGGAESMGNEWEIDGSPTISPIVFGNSFHHVNICKLSRNARRIFFGHHIYIYM